MEKITFKRIKKVSDLIAQKFRPEKIILFGSFAWGKPGRDSDIDFLIIKNIKKNNKHHAQIYLSRILFGNGVPVDTLIYTKKEIERRLNLGDFFIEDIINKGKVLYEK